MKKLKFILLALLGLMITAWAVKSSEAMAQAGCQDQPQSQTRRSICANTPSTESQIKNQNQIQTENQGENSQIQTQNQEQENSGAGEGLETRSQKAIQNMSEVAKQVQQLLQVRTSGGIGEQVREIARVQNQAQEQIQEQLSELDSKGRLARLLTGTNHGAVKNLKALLEQNQLRIRQLEQLANQLSSQSEITTVQAAIQALIQENVFLQERITAEEQTKSLFGWLLRLFSK